MKPRTVVVREGKRSARVEVLGPRLGSQAEKRLARCVLRRVLNLDEDLSGFYDAAADDPELAWASQGAGRMLRSPTVFEEVIKTICTTNCAWSATVRMTTALVEHLGEPSAGDHGRAFPQPAAMAEAGEAFYRDVVRAGYRGAYLRSIAAAVAAGELDLEQLLDPELEDADVAERLLALPGVGPVRRGARDDAARPLLEPRPRLVDETEVRAARGEEEGRGLHDHPALSPLRPLCRPRVLALSDAGLGAGPRCQDFVRIRNPPLHPVPGRVPEEHGQKDIHPGRAGAHAGRGSRSTLADLGDDRRRPDGGHLRVEREALGRRFAREIDEGAGLAGRRASRARRSSLP